MSRLARPVAVLAVSAGTLAYEILLVRLFAIEQFHHLAYLAVGVAMLGLGASGTVFAVARARRPLNVDAWFSVAALLTPAVLLAAPLLADLVTVDAATLVWDPRQWMRLALLQAVLAVPFAVGGLVTLAALAGAGDRPGLVYGAGFAGAGLGAALAVGALWILTPVRALAVPALLAVPAVWSAAALARRPGAWRGAALVTVALAAAALGRPPWRLDLLPYKGLAQVRVFPGASVVAERSSPVGWIVAVQAPAFRFAPGLSLIYDGAFPEQTALFSDGELVGARSAWDSASRALLDWQPSALPYAVARPERVLVLTPGGGHEVASAVLHGAREVIAVELHPAVAALAEDQRLGVLSDRAAPAVRWVVGDARALLARATERLDLITLGPFAGGSPGAGTATLREDFLHTVEAYARCLEMLAPGGVLAVTDWLAVPPRAEVRTILTVGEAVRRVAPARAGAALVVVRSWGAVTTLVKPDGFSAEDVARIEAWTAARRFDVDWRPGLEAPGSRYNFMERPVLFEAARAAARGDQDAARLAGAYPFDVRPATDARPYAHVFLGWRTLKLVLSERRGDWLPFAEWGYVTLLATLAQGVVLATLLLLLPALGGRGGARVAHRASIVGYFGAIGFGYLLAEIAAIQQLTLLLGHPVYAVAAVLALILVSSGVGSVWSDRLTEARAARIGWGLATAAVILALGALPLVHGALGAAAGVRFGVAALLLVPLAFAMGMPFALGLRLLAGAEQGRVAWAWAANGFASVIAAPLAALLALELGSPFLFVGAGIAYGGAGWVAEGGRRGTT